jgi:hypothetical protein
MAPKHRTASFRWVNMQERESSTPELGAVRYSTSDADRECGPEQEIPQEGPTEVTMGQVFNKIAEILRQLAEQRTTRWEDVALEQFLKF